MIRQASALVLLFAIPASAAADEVVLRSGHKIVGIEHEEKDRIVIETGYGTVAFPRDQVVSVTKGRTPLHAWPVRYAEIEKSTNPRDFLQLAAWARENDLPRYVEGLLRRVLELDPENAEARAALGFVRHEGKWLTKAELRKEQGQVQDRGRWVSPLEKDLEERRRLQAEERRLDREETRSDREERRRRARQDAEIEARVRAAELSTMDFGTRRGGWRPQFRDRGHWDGLYDLMLIDWILGFRALPGTFPFGGLRGAGVQNSGMRGESPMTFTLP